MKKSIVKRCISLVTALALVLGTVFVTTGQVDAASSATLTVKERYGDPQLKWSKVEGAETYYIYRASEAKGKAGTFKKLAEISADNSRSYENYGVKSGKTYYYKVVAVASSESSAEEIILAETKEVKYTAKLWKPSIVNEMWHVYVDAASGNPVIDWDGNDKNTDTFQIWRATKKTGKYTKIGTTTKTKFVDKKGKVNKKYYYKIKAICKSNSAANSDFSNIVSVKKVKGDKKLAKAIKSDTKKKVYTLNETLSIGAKNKLSASQVLGGVSFLAYHGKLTPHQVYGFSKIKKAGAVVKRSQTSGAGSAFHAYVPLYVSKNKVNYGMFNMESFEINTFKVKKSASQKTIVKDIKKTVAKYYPTKKWSISVEKYNASKKKFKGEVNDLKGEYNQALKDCGYKKYKSDKYKYVLTIKSKTNKKQVGWTFVTVMPQ